ncbi:hypothetical protein Acr_17g0007120 [Actinidia rufa]|uniref:Uncharacterized protein n=1 Tax=Actinidia rufa TaxID=165716 RepID=A0A7J0G2Y1_9ERIC|nr:hypothetical protein Acr_17g0007120 [Actinidia rufa]
MVSPASGSLVQTPTERRHDSARSFSSSWFIILVSFSGGDLVSSTNQGSSQSSRGSDTGYSLTSIEATKAPKKFLANQPNDAGGTSIGSKPLRPPIKFLASQPNQAKENHVGLKPRRNYTTFSSKQIKHKDAPSDFRCQVLEEVSHNQTKSSKGKGPSDLHAMEVH